MITHDETNQTTDDQKKTICNTISECFFYNDDYIVDFILIIVLPYKYLQPTNGIVFPPGVPPPPRGPALHGRPLAERALSPALRRTLRVLTMANEVWRPSVATLWFCKACNLLSKIPWNVIPWNTDPQTGEMISWTSIGSRVLFHD